MYYRKAEDKKRLKKLHDTLGDNCVAGAYYKNGKYWRRFSKSDLTIYRDSKLYARRVYRRRANKADYKLSKHVYDLYWDVW